MHLYVYDTVHVLFRQHYGELCIGEENGHCGDLVVNAMVACCFGSCQWFRQVPAKRQRILFEPRDLAEYICIQHLFCQGSPPTRSRTIYTYHMYVQIVWNFILRELAPMTDRQLNAGQAAFMTIPSRQIGEAYVLQPISKKAPCRVVVFLFYSSKQ